MLARQIERLKPSAKINRLLVATSDNPSDDPIKALCGKLNVDCFRGSLEDVLDRFYNAALVYSCDHVVRLTGDNPLMDPRLVDAVIEFHLSQGNDYTSNMLEPSYPDGLDVEVFRFECLKNAWQEATLPSQREHVTLFIYEQSQRFQIGSFKGENDLSSHRWTVDEPEDFELVSRIYKALYPQNPFFTMDDVLGLIDSQPDLKAINAKFERNEGLKKSQERDADFLEKGRGD